VWPAGAEGRRREKFAFTSAEVTDALALEVFSANSCVPAQKCWETAGLNDLPREMSVS
jgi:hypothetical protein